MLFRRFLLALASAICASAFAQTTTKVVDVPVRAGVADRILFISPAAPKATLLLFPGGHGGLQMLPDGALKWGKGNFLVRTRQQFVDRGVAVALVDAPSDRQSPPFLASFRQTAEHVADIGALIAWARAYSTGPVWLVGTRRGTQSVAYAATQLQGADAPDGIVLSSTILIDDKNPPVSAMALDKVRIPVLVEQHQQDACKHCAPTQLPALMSKLVNAPRKELLMFKGGESRGDPCEAMAYHGFNGIEPEVVNKTVAWILDK